MGYRIVKKIEDNTVYLLDPWGEVLYLESHEDVDSLVGILNKNSDENTSYTYERSKFT